MLIIYRASERKNFIFGASETINKWWFEAGQY